MSPPEIVIRRARPDENNAVHALVQTIADETFVGLFATRYVPIGEADWCSAWLAISNDEIVGVTMAREEWVNDLWVRRDRPLPTPATTTAGPRVTSVGGRVTKLDKTVNG